MRGGKNKTGYTITEVLIVLAISSSMFLVANTFLSGRVAETNFRTGVNEMASLIQDVIDQVNYGQYNDRPITCSINGGGIIETSQGGANEQGSNTPCIYIGKIFTFNANSQIYYLDTLAGKKLTDDNATINTIAPTTINSLRLSKTFPGGLKYNSNSNYTFGFIQNPNSSVQAGSSNVDNLWTYDGNAYSSTSRVSICLIGTNSRTAKISIGANANDNNNTTVTTDFLSGC